MRGVRFAGGLLAAVLVHLAGVALWPSFSLAVDLFLVVALFHALDGRTLPALVGGLAAGLVTDALTGGLYGLHGFADTMLGYGAAFAAQRLSVQRSTSVWLLFSLAAALQQLVLTALVLVLLPDPEVPAVGWVVAKVGTTGVLGLALSEARGTLTARLASWRRNRTARLRMGR